MDKSVPQSKIDAIRNNSSHFFTGKPCKNGHIAKRRVSDGHCLKCDSEHQKRKRRKNQHAYQKKRKEYYEKNKARILDLKKIKYAESEIVKLQKRRRDLKRQYNMTLEDYEAMLESQNGCCKICKSPDNKNKRTQYFDVDHNHKTNKVRGLLCTNCNHLIGKANDNPQILLAVINYLHEADG